MSVTDIDELVPGYRDIPEDKPYRESEHHPICDWCKHFTSDIANVLSMVRGGPFLQCSLHRSGLLFSAGCPNHKGSCGDYAPSAGTRVRQLVRLRPFVPRISGVTSQRLGPRVVSTGPEGQVKVLRID